MSIVATPYDTQIVKAGGVELARCRETFYFDYHRGVYWTCASNGTWIMVNETQAKLRLRSFGVSRKIPEGSQVSPLDERLLDIQDRLHVHYAGPLAGYRAGPHMIGEKRILVTDSPRLILPEEGEWPNLRQLIDGLLVQGDCDQRPFLFGWLKVAFEALAAGQRRPGQALALCGPAGSGKSLLQLMITSVLGGRSASPYQYMTGKTPFNADLFEAEHLQIEDDHSNTDIRARRNFGTSIKAFCVNETHRLHDKGRRAFNGLKPFWRITITVNDEPESLMVMPPIDDGLADKLILLRAFKRPMPMPTTTNDERSAFRTRLEAELPAFLHFLTKWEIPTEISSARFGVTHYHHPELVAAINALSPEQKLLRLIDAELFSFPVPSTWRGTAAELEHRLTGDESRCAHEARKVLDFPGACGAFLGRLKKELPDRIASTRDDRRYWIIKPPPQ